MMIVNEASETVSKAWLNDFLFLCVALISVSLQRSRAVTKTDEMDLASGTA